MSAEKNTREDLNAEDQRRNADKLSQNVMQQLRPVLDQISSKNNDIIKTQIVLKESLQRENDKLNTSNGAQEIKVAMAKVKFYQNKMEELRKEMKFLQNKTKDLKQRGLKLQEKKNAQDKKLEEKRKKQHELEESLVAKSVTNLPSK